MVELVIVARQMQHAVENQNLEFIGSRVTVTASTGQSDIGGDGNIATLDTGKGKNVRGLILLSETAVQFVQAAIPRDQNVDFTPHAAKLFRFSSETCQPPVGYTLDHFLQNDHFFWKPTGRAASPP